MQCVCVQGNTRGGGAGGGAACPACFADTVCWPWPAGVRVCAAFKSSDAGWAVARGNKGEAAGGGKFSAFLGEYVAVASQAAEVAGPSGRWGACLALAWLPGVAVQLLPLLLLSAG